LTKVDEAGYASTLVNVAASLLDTDPTVAALEEALGAGSGGRPTAVEP
jgi:hypothetical protein